MIKHFRILYAFALLGTLMNIQCEETDSKFEEINADNEVSREKLESTIKQLMENLKKQNYNEDGTSVHENKKRNVDENVQEEVTHTCGEGILQRCKRDFKPIPGHKCENIKPLDPKGPFCNCPLCMESKENKKESREINFDDLEAIKSESVKLNPGASVYQEKWNPDHSDPSTSDVLKKTPLQESVEKLASEEIPKRNLFSCKKIVNIFEIEKQPTFNDPEFQEQLKSITDEEFPSKGILKYQEKLRSREEGDL